MRRIVFASLAWCFAGMASAETISLNYSWSTIVCGGEAYEINDSSCEGVGGAAQTEKLTLKTSRDPADALVGEWIQSSGDLQATIRIYRYKGESGDYGRYNVSAYVTNSKGETAEAEIGFDDLKINPSLSLKSIPVTTAGGNTYAYFNVYLNAAGEEEVSPSAGQQ